MNEKLIEAIKKVTQLQGTASFENEIRTYLKDVLPPYVDEIQTDGLGGIFGIKYSKVENAPTVMVAAHMDEVGFMISEITEHGFFHVVPIGGWNPYVVQAQRFSLITRIGKKYPVISSSVPPHLLRGTDGTQKFQISDILFDAGFEDAKEVKDFGIEIGDFIIPETEPIISANGKNMLAKAWDNRYGIMMITEALKTLKDIDLAVNLVIGANVQEEVGLRGAHISTTKFNPDLFIAVDCSPADDLDKANGNGPLGKGPIIRLYDP
ncbi:MAG: glutamyl aminopeptidase, partial [Streptococcaceae bacterium]|nr:glutamyl aminopeptidase [Streptococcaceae bacterium]